MGHICEANRGLGRGFIDEGGSATIRVGKGEAMVDINDLLGCPTDGDTGGCGSGMKTGRLMGEQAVGIDNGIGSKEVVI